VKGRFVLGIALLAAAAVTGASADSAAHQKKIAELKDVIGIWTFEDSFADSAPGKNNARAGGNAAAVTFAPGVNGGRAVHIDNRNDEHNFVEVSTPIGSIFDQPKFSVVGWAKNEKVREVGGGDNWNSLVDRNSIWYASTHSIEVDGKLVTELVVRIYNSGQGASTDQIGRLDKDTAPEKPRFFHNDEWHQFGITYDGEKVISYMDGEKYAEFEYDGGVGPTSDFTPSNPADNPNVNLTWGLWEQKGDDFTGSFDDTIYASRALTADEIKSLFDAMMAKP
jgi:hypothetical protein